MGREGRGSGSSSPNQWGWGGHSKGHRPHSPSSAAPRQCPSSTAREQTTLSTTQQQEAGLGKGKPTSALREGQEKQGKGGVQREGRLEFTPDPSHTITPGGLSVYPDLESVIQSEVSQKEKNKYSMLTHIYGI